MTDTDHIIEQAARAAYLADSWGNEVVARQAWDEASATSPVKKYWLRLATAQFEAGLLTDVPNVDKGKSPNSTSVFARLTISVDVNLETEPPRSSPNGTELGYEFFVIRRAEMISLKVDGDRAALALLEDGIDDLDPDGLLLESVGGALRREYALDHADDDVLSSLDPLDFYDPDDPDSRPPYPNGRPPGW